MQALDNLSTQGDHIGNGAGTPCPDFIRGEFDEVGTQRCAAPGPHNIVDDRRDPRVVEVGVHNTRHMKNISSAAIFTRKCADKVFKVGNAAIDTSPSAVLAVAAGAVLDEIGGRRMTSRKGKRAA